MLKAISEIKGVFDGIDATRTHVLVKYNNSSIFMRDLFYKLSINIGIPITLFCTDTFEDNKRQPYGEEVLKLVEQYVLSKLLDTEYKTCEFETLENVGDEFFRYEKLIDYLIKISKTCLNFMVKSK